MKWPTLRRHYGLFLEVLSYRIISVYASLIAVAATVLLSVSAFAAQKVIVKAGIFQISIPVSQLEHFAETGEMSSSLSKVVKATKQDPPVIRHTLTHEVAVDFLFLERALNHPLGELLLDKLGEVVHTPSNQANRQALRSAVVLSAAADNKISLLEVIQNYPTSEVEVEGERIIDAAEHLRRFSDGLKALQQRLPRIP
ncbi:MAG: alpha/beta hydrolase [Oscillatoriaceae bacterium SKW80]|nr:alpha/beta hydrolase [Oscillatoriaceae bacterium SKYG93]MCX8120931.1 alpha/beta hydrolase [Oscillatoriaceae bacterium SKW80]MDW8452204.1 alpha/beta hydrolase [Oscillatoriaceae cyanobacterium SKYGB_i_bin93]HIK26540.1 alpha/beta hydrolase [Oscillatoriaceae cyanobacterium M7585_C2015_266]